MNYYIQKGLTIAYLDSLSEKERIFMMAGMLIELENKQKEKERWDEIFKRL